MMLSVILLAGDTTVYSKSDQASDLWQKLELASKLEFDLQGTVDWSQKLLVDFNAWEKQLISFDQSNNTGGIDVKKHESVFEEKSSFKMVGSTFSSKLDWGFYIISIARTASKKFEPFYEVSFSWVCSVSL